MIVQCPGLPEEGEGGEQILKFRSDRRINKRLSNTIQVSIEVGLFIFIAKMVYKYQLECQQLTFGRVAPHLLSR